MGQGSPGAHGLAEHLITMHLAVTLLSVAEILRDTDSAIYNPCSTPLPGEKAREQTCARR